MPKGGIQMSKYQLPPAVLQKEIRYMQWYGGSDCIAVPFSSELEHDSVEALAKLVGDILKDETGIPQTTEEKSGNKYETFYSFQVHPNGTTTPFMHIPRYKVNATKIAPDSISGAESLVVVVAEEKACQHCAKSLERLTEILSTL